MYEAAADAAPGRAEDYLTYSFMGAARGHLFRRQQQLAVRLNKTYGKKRYLFWTIASILFQAQAARGTPAAKLPLMLAEKMIEKAAEEGKVESLEEFQLYLQVLEESSNVAGMLALVDGPLGSKIYKVESDRLSLRVSLLLKLRHFRRANATARSLILTERRDDWSLFTAYFDSLFAVIGGENVEGDDPAGADTTVEQAHAFVTAVIEAAPAIRGPRLAAMELLRRVAVAESRTSEDKIEARVEEYFGLFGAKFCFFGDVRPFLSLVPAARREALTTTLTTKAAEGEYSVTVVRRQTGAEQVRSFFFPPDSLSPAANEARAAQLVAAYRAALPLGVGLEASERQHGDDLLLLAAHSLFYAALSSSGAERTRLLLRATAFAESGLEASSKNFQLRMFALACHVRLGNWMRSSELFQELGTKHVQHDTLSYLMLDYVADLAVYGEEAAANVSHALTIYGNNKRETPEMIVQAFYSGTYSKIREFMNFQLRLDNSIQRHLLTLEMRRAWLVEGEATPAATLATVAQFPENDFTIAEQLATASDNRDRRVFVEWGTPAIAEQLRPAPFRNAYYIEAHNIVMRIARRLGGTAEERAQLGELAGNVETLVAKMVAEKTAIASDIAKLSAVAGVARAAHATFAVFGGDENGAPAAISALSSVSSLLSSLVGDACALTESAPFDFASVAAQSHALEALSHAALFATAASAAMPSKKGRKAATAPAHVTETTAAVAKFVADLAVALKKLGDSATATAAVEAADAAVEGDTEEFKEAVAREAKSAAEGAAASRNEIAALCESKIKNLPSFA